ncbi:hypothetical protein GCM10009682_28310 [Luedemannella flava]|uniref:PH domain-containing protein n=1 Tax=Luedemannella flava TaxID=349316 RepID=A0ABN2M0A1_9ACTN
MPGTESVDRANWVSALEQLTARHAGDAVTIELLDDTYGDLDEAERVPLSSVVYDPRDDVVVVAVGAASGDSPGMLRHLVGHPTGVDIYETSAGAALRVTTEGSTMIVSFHRG